MNIIVLEVPIHQLSNNIIKGRYETIYYSIMLDETRFSDYNKSLTIPANTVITKNAKELIKMDWDTKEINLLFNKQSLMNEYAGIKNVKTGLIDKHPIIDELIDNTPIMIEKDSIQQSLWLIKLSKIINSYEPAIPQNMINKYAELTGDIQRIKPVNTTFNLASFNNGFAFTGNEVSSVKESFRIKRLEEKNVYQFTRTGAPFYSLGKLARLCLELDNMWNR